MSTQSTTTCDFCGMAKRDVNHWWKLWVNCPIDGGVVQSTMGIAHWDGSGSRTKDACGEACVQKAVSRFLSTGSLEEK